MGAKKIDLHEEYNRKKPHLQLVNPDISVNNSSPANDYYTFKLYKPISDFFKFFPIHLSHWIFDSTTESSEDAEIKKRIAESKQDFHHMFFF